MIPVFDLRTLTLLQKMVVTFVRNPQLRLLVLYVLLFLSFQVQAKCGNGCDLALASYYVSQGSNLTYISTIFNQSIPEILRYNPDIPNEDSIRSNTRINVPFSCDCLNGEFLGHTFAYISQPDDTYLRIARKAFANLTTGDWVHRVNIYVDTRIPNNAALNVTVNCSCGDRRVSKDYGLFVTYPLRPEDNLSSIAAESGLLADLLQRYNLGTNFNSGTGIVYLPAKG